eukprot:scaffold2724_cov260-Pinguiococcus_pyrenoidosus.AAC.16
MSAGAEKNMAFVFVKPHAAGSPKVIELLKERLAATGIAGGALRRLSFPSLLYHSAACSSSPQLARSSQDLLCLVLQRKRTIKVTAEGVMDAKTIDEMKYIDTHYGAIASKAVSLKPSELNGKSVLKPPCFDPGEVRTPL